MILKPIKIVTYFSVFKFWFTLRAPASSEAPESPTLLDSRLWKRVLQVPYSLDITPPLFGDSRMGGGGGGGGGTYN